VAVSAGVSPSEFDFLPDRIDAASEPHNDVLVLPRRDVANDIPGMGDRLKRAQFIPGISIVAIGADVIFSHAASPVGSQQETDGQQREESLNWLGRIKERQTGHRLFSSAKPVGVHFMRAAILQVEQFSFDRSRAQGRRSLA
jgi:hypothetical protein